MAASASIAQPNRPVEKPADTALDRIFKGLQIANQVIGGVGGVQNIMEKSDLSDAAKAAADRQKAGIYTQEEYDKTFSPEKTVTANEATPGAMLRHIQNGDQTQDVYVAPRQSKLDPSEVNLKNAQAAEATANSQKTLQQLQELKQKAANPAEIDKKNMLPGQTKEDQLFAAQDVHFQEAGGKEGIQKSLDNLRSARDELIALKEKNSWTAPGSALARFTGGNTGLTPEALSLGQRIKAAVTPVAMALNDGARTSPAVLTSIQQGTFDGRVPIDDNIQRISSQIDTLSAQAEAKQAASDYFQKNHTLQGFAPNKADLSAPLKKVIPTPPGGGGKNQSSEIDLSKPMALTLPDGTPYKAPPQDVFQEIQKRKAARGQ